MNSDVEALIKKIYIHIIAGIVEFIENIYYLVQYAK